MTMLRSQAMQQRGLSGPTYVPELLQIERKNNVNKSKLSFQESVMSVHRLLYIILAIQQNFQ